MWLTRSTLTMVLGWKELMLNLLMTLHSSMAREFRCIAAFRSKK